MTSARTVANTLLGVKQELAVGLAHLNFDFSLVKVSFQILMCKTVGNHGCVD